MSAIAWHEVEEVATKGDLRTEVAELRAELKADLAHLEVTLTRTMAKWMITILVAMITAVASVAFIS